MAPRLGLVSLFSPLSSLFLLLFSLFSFLFSLPSSLSSSSFATLINKKGANAIEDHNGVVTRLEYHDEDRRKALAKTLKTPFSQRTSLFRLL